MQGRSPQPCRRRACPAQADGPHRRARWETLRHTVNQDGPTGRALTTGVSIMMFEETVPAGTKARSSASRQRRSGLCPERRGHVKIGDEVTVGGPGTCACMPRGVPHAWESAGAETGRVLFLYTPDRAGGLLEEQQRTHRKSASMNSQAIVVPCTLPFAERI